MKKIIMMSGTLALLLVGGITATHAVEVSTILVNPQNMGQSDTSSGFFTYKNDDALSDSIKTIEQLGYQSDLPANALDLKTNHEDVIVFTPEHGVKQLLPGNAIGAFGYHMQQQSFPSQDALAIKKNLITNNQMGSQIQLTYDVLYNGQRMHSDRLITIPPNGLAVSFMEVDDGKILVVITRPD